jgi:CspA family cold shock protein
LQPLAPARLGRRISAELRAVVDDTHPPDGLRIDVEISGGWPPGLQEWLEEKAKTRAILETLPVAQVQQHAISGLEQAASNLRGPLSPESKRHGWTREFADALAGRCGELMAAVVAGTYEKAWAGGELVRSMSGLSGMRGERDELWDSVYDAELVLDAYRNRLPGKLARANVAFWHQEDGWGGISDPDRDGIGFVHFSMIEMDGYRELIPGATVEYEWADDRGQDGCQWRAAWVRPLADRGE